VKPADSLIDDIEKKTLLKILNLGRSIETGHEAQSLRPLPQAPLSQILLLASSLAYSPSLAVQRIAEMADQIHPEMDLRKFQNFLVPIERYLDRSAKDHDFIIGSADRLSAKAIRRPLVAVMDHFRSAFNVGSMFRAADAFGFEALHLVGYTPSPLQASVQKTALGSDQSVPWKQWDRLDDCLRELRALDYEIVGLETSSDSIPIYDFRFGKKTALLLGNERFGINPSDLASCDRKLQIPMQGIKNSLNVVSAFSIASFEWSRQNL